MLIPQVQFIHCHDKVHHKLGSCSTHIKFDLFCGLNKLVSISLTHEVIDVTFKAEVHYVQTGSLSSNGFHDLQICRIWHRRFHYLVFPH